MDITKIEIHTMKLADLDEIKELVNNNSSYLVLRYDNKIVGYGGIKIILDEAELMNIVTKKDKRNMGFARLILNELIEISKEHNCSKLNLEVNEKNSAAIHLYELFDFKQVGLRKQYYNGKDNAILMTLDL